VDTERSYDAGLSVLGPRPDGDLRPVDPSVLSDLSLDRIVESLNDRGRDRLVTTLLTELPPDLDTVEYRQEVAHDLRDQEVRRAVTDFRTGMAGVGASVAAAQKPSYGYHWQERRVLAEAMARYGELVTRLSQQLEGADLGSRGLRAMRDHLLRHRSSQEFEELVSSTDATLAGLDAVSASLRIEPGRITVSPAGDDGEYSQQVAELFGRFVDESQPVEHRPFKRAHDPGLTHIAAQVVAEMARLFPEPFQALEEHCRRHGEFRDPVLLRFADESRFYLTYLDMVASLEARGLTFSRPRLSLTDKTVHARDCFDLSLALRLAPRDVPVTNDVRLDGPERILVITGPNQGGKTTYSRMVGQLHHLAALGLPVPGRDVTCPLVDRVLTHFERVEGVDDPTGKLEDELVRLRRILQVATPRSLVVMNEIFTSTSLQDARTLGERVLRQLIERDVLTVYVTFVDELSVLDPATVSLVSQVSDDDPDRRTFRVVRQPANGVARALALARRYGLTSDQLLERIRP
jgi:hypothetical protein